MTSGGFSSKRLTRVRDVLSRHLDAGYVPGAVAVVARHGEVHVEAMGNLAFEGESSRTPMAADTICRIGSMTKPIVAACAMTLVEDCRKSAPGRRLGAFGGWTMRFIPLHAYRLVRGESPAPPALGRPARPSAVLLRRVSPRRLAGLQDEE